MSNASSPKAFSRKITRLTRALILAVLAGVILAAVMVLRTGRPEPLPLAASALQANTLVNAANEPRASNDTVLRPLFWQERRPQQEPERAPVVQVAQGSRLEGVQLVGAFDAEGTSGVILNVRGTPKRLALGEELEGWQLLTVDADATQATFGGAGNDDQQLTLVLERKMHE